MGMKPRPARSESVRLERYVELSASSVLESSLTWAASAGWRPVQGQCSHCGATDDEGSVCLICVVFARRGEVISPASEFMLADKLGVTQEWLVDLVGGFDGDSEHQEHKSAWTIGRRLWRRHGAT